MCHYNVVADASRHGSAGKEVLVSVCGSHENRTACHLSVQEMLPGNTVSAADALTLDSLVEMLARNRKLQRLSSYRQLQAISQQVKWLSNGRFATLDDFRIPEGVFIGPVQAGQERGVLQDGGRRRAFVRAGVLGECEFQLPHDIHWWKRTPLCTIQLGQGSIGSAGCAFAITHLNCMVSVRWDMFHRGVRDCKLAMERIPSLLRAQLYSSYVWSMSYRPFGSSAFFQSKQRILEDFLGSETPCSFPPFLEQWELIRDDLQMDPMATIEQVFQQLAELTTFKRKGALVKLRRWFSWLQSADECLPEFRTTRIILKHAPDEVHLTLTQTLAKRSGNCKQQEPQEAEQPKNR